MTRKKDQRKCGGKNANLSKSNQNKMKERNKEWRKVERKDQTDNGRRKEGKQGEMNEDTGRSSAAEQGIERKNGR